MSFSKARWITVKFASNKEDAEETSKKRFYVSKGWGAVRVNGESYTPYVLCCLVEALLYGHRHTVNHVSVYFPSFPSYEELCVVGIEQQKQGWDDCFEKITAALKRWRSLGQNPRVDVHPTKWHGYIYVGFRPQFCHRPL